MPNLCSVDGCLSNTESSIQTYGKISTYAIPRDQELRKKWIIACNRGHNYNPSKYTFICRNHFNEDDFEYYVKTNNRILGIPLQSPRLKRTAIPTTSGAFWKFPIKPNTLEPVSSSILSTINNTLTSQNISNSNQDQTKLTSIIQNSTNIAEILPTNNFKTSQNTSYETQLNNNAESTLQHEPAKRRRTDLKLVSSVTYQTLRQPTNENNFTSNQTNEPQDAYFSKSHINTPTEVNRPPIVLVSTAKLSKNANLEPIENYKNFLQHFQEKLCFDKRPNWRYFIGESVTLYQMDGDEEFGARIVVKVVISQKLNVKVIVNDVEHTILPIIPNLINCKIVYWSQIHQIINNYEHFYRVLPNNIITSRTIEHAMENEINNEEEFFNPDIVYSEVDSDDPLFV